MCDEGRFRGKKVRPVFKEKEGSWPGRLFITPNSARERRTFHERYSDILIEGCGFDYNGNPGRDGSATETGKFQALVTIVNAEKVTLRNNLFFDSQRPKCYKRFCQRQQAIIFVEDVLVEKNKLIDGGRIKVGVPARRAVIRNNILDFVNDNGITIVDINDPPKATSELTSEEVRAILDQYNPSIFPKILLSKAIKLMTQLLLVYFTVLMVVV